MTRVRSWVGRVLVALVALCVCVPATPAYAHNELVRATPADGTTFRQLPKTGTLTFAETLGPGDLSVVVDGASLPLTPVPGNAHAMTYALRGVEPAATVVVTWTVVDSHDGHRSGGSLRLHVTGGPATPTPSTSPAGSGASADTASGDAEPRLLGWLDFAAHLVGYVAMTLLVGGLIFLSLLWPAGTRVRRARVLLGGAASAGLMAAGASTGVVLWRAADRPVSEVLASDYGRASTSMLLLWLLAAVVVAAVLQLGPTAVQGVAWRVGAIAVSGGIIRVAGINAHATQGDERLLGIAADFLHLVAVSAWIGGLVMLSTCVLPRGRLSEVEDVVPRFSRVALLSVLTLVCSGLLLVWDISRGIDGFWETHYARVLLLKLAVFALVMLAAMKSKHWVQTALADAVAGHRRTAVRPFAVSVAAETVLVMAVLAAASVLVTSSPGM